MRLVYSLHNYPPVHNAGAETMAHAINRWLQARGHTVEVLARDLPAGVDTWEGITIRRRGPVRWVDRIFAASSAAITHLDETPIAATAAIRTTTPLAHVLHNDRQLTFHNVTPVAAALIVANTAWVADRVPANLSSVPVVVVHPPTLDVATLPATGLDRQAVTLVNLLEAKGAPLFYRLAAASPARPFIAVTGAYGPQLPPPRLPNITTRPNRPDMAPVWARTRVLVAPSSYESFGKAAVEALAHGIPVIAHPTPGLVEALGPAGIFVDRDDDAGWLQALADLDDATTYAAASKAARARALELEATTLAQLENLETALAAIARH